MVLFFLSVLFGNQQASAEKKETYSIGTDITFAPFEFSKSDGTYTGIDIELIERISEMNGFNIQLNPVGFSPAVQAVEAGQMDGVIAGMTMTDERKQTFDFSEPYFQSGIQMAVAKDNVSIQSFDDLKGKTVGAKTGTESAEFLEKNKAKYGYKVKLFDSSDVLYNVVGVGNVDAIFDDYPVVGYAVKQGTPLRLVGDFVKGGSYGFAVKKGQNQELLQMFNKGLAELKSSGEYDKILAKFIETPESTSSESTFTGLIKTNYKALLNGLWRTVYITFISFAIALVFGVLLGLMNVGESKALQLIATFFIDIIRGIPLYVLALFIFMGIPSVTGIKLNENIAGILTLSLNASAYIAEIVRGGIDAVPKGQTEAARSLGLTYGKTMQKIILPQAFKIMIPSFINQFVITFKDTTILSAIGMMELLKTGQIIIARNLQSFNVLLIVAIMYIVVITALTKLSKRIERKVQRNG